ncbi:Sensor histidine kinase YycG [compost metagenome]
MLRYWTTRYLLTLCIGLITIGILSFFWLQYYEKQKQLDYMDLLAADTAELVVIDGRLALGYDLFNIVERKQKMIPFKDKPCFILLDENKLLISSSMYPEVPDDIMSHIQSFAGGGDRTETFQVGPGHGLSFYAVQKEVEHNGRTLGWVIILQPEKLLVTAPWQVHLLIILVLSLGLLGWAVIYLLTRRLYRPIGVVVNAAEQIVAGNYDLSLYKGVKEQEIYELMNAFEEMAKRLKQMELMRTQLLAGVTHELKTPVTSISGLIQAVQEDVVSGEEAKEFLDICRHETNRLQHMIEDLLEFNSFAVGDFKVHKETVQLQELVKDILRQWELTQEARCVKVLLGSVEEELEVFTDPLRLQQILYNLLNNARQASDASIGEAEAIPRIEVEIMTTSEEIILDVKDWGNGIPAVEQALVFERFYRGEGKKHKVRGLGIGLPFSRMMARSLGGELLLLRSGQGETVFRLVLPVTDSPLEEVKQA